MSKCPKCGSHNIIGPHYEDHCSGKYAHSGERLRYTCGQCGYSETAPTLDAKQKGAS